MSNKRTVRAFVSYAHADKEYAHMLIEGIKINTRHSLNFKWDIWIDTRINLGQKWDEEIQSKVWESNVAILLVSPNFLYSGYIEDKEFKAFIQRAEEEKDFRFFLFC